MHQHQPLRGVAGGAASHRSAPLTDPAAKPKLASGPKRKLPGERAFVLPSLAAELPWKTAHRYDELVSGRAVYTYVGNDPLDRTDPSGLAGCTDASGQGLAGKCIDATAYNEKKDGTQTTVSKPDVDTKATETAPGLENKNTERATTINRASDGTLTAGTAQQGKDNSAGQQTGVTPTTATVAIEHSHPNNSDYGIEPGYQGRGRGDHTAVERGYPNYITRDGKVIVIERSGGQYRARVVSGSLTPSEARDVRRALNDLQQESRSRSQ